MSLAAHTAVALGRGMAVGVLAVAAGLPLRNLLASAGRGTRRLAWAAVLAPYLTPVLLVGYAYSNFSLSLVRHPGWNALLYSLLLWMKLVPVAVLVLWFAPSPLSPQAVHCRRLLRAGERGFRARLDYLAFLCRGPVRDLAVAFTLVFLLAFAEFEMASLMGVRTWTVSIFDAQAGGLSVAESLRLSLVPIAVEVALLVVALRILFGARGVPAGPSRRPAGGRLGRWFASAYLVVAVLLVTALPAGIVLRGTLGGLSTVVGSFALGRDIAASLLFAGAGAAGVYLVAGWFSGRALSHGGSRGGLLCGVGLSVTGLLGPLVLALLMVFVFQALRLRHLYDTPVPLVVALALVLFPFALLLRVLLHAFRPGSALHAAELLGASGARRVRRWRGRLVWEMKARGRFWVGFLLFCWGYFDLTASAILAPPGMTTVTVRLYNLMHYGQTAVLSAMVCVAFAVPVVVLLVAGAAGVLWSRRLAHG